MHTIPLKKLIDKATPAKKGGPPRQPRYVVALKRRAPSFTFVAIVITVIVALFGIAGQFLFELYGLTDQPVIGVHKYVPASWQRVPQQPVSAGLLTEAIAGVRGEGKAVILDGKDGEVKVDAHDVEQHGDAKLWDELPEYQQDAWKEKLKEAGHWGEDMGETILKSLFFGEVAGLVQGVLLEGKNV